MRRKVAAVNLHTSYHIPVPLRAKIQVCGRIKSHDGRTTFTFSTIRLPDGSVAVAKKGNYVGAEYLYVDLHKDIWIETY